MCPTHKQVFWGGRCHLAVARWTQSRRSKVQYCSGASFIKIHLISPSCPRPNSPFKVQKSGLKHRHFIFNKVLFAACSFVSLIFFMHPKPTIMLYVSMHLFVSYRLRKATWICVSVLVCVCVCARACVRARNSASISSFVLDQVYWESPCQSQRSHAGERATEKKRAVSDSSTVTNLPLPISHRSRADAVSIKDK